MCRNDLSKVIQILKSLINTIIRINNKVDKLEGLFKVNKEGEHTIAKQVLENYEKMAQSFCEHNWICITKNSYNADGTVRDWIFECSKCGKKQISGNFKDKECSHNWELIGVQCDNTEYTYRCNKCYARKVEYKGKCKHDWVYCDTEDKWYCNKCGKVEIPPKEECKHEWELKDHVANLKTLKEESYFECKKCNKSKSEEITDVLLYKLTGRCNHNWVFVEILSNCEPVVVEESYSGQVIIKPTKRINEFIFKCSRCEQKKTIKEGTAEQFAMGMKKLVDALPTTEQVAKNIQQRFCEHDWGCMGSSSYYKCNDLKTLSGWEWVNAWKYRCKKCGIEKIEPE